LSNLTHDQTVEILEQLASEDISQLNVKVARLNAKLEELESGSELRDTSNCCDTLSGQITALRSDKVSLKTLKL
jgi:predicted nuclease with TOPRIM domain